MCIPILLLLAFFRTITYECLRNYLPFRYNSRTVAEIHLPLVFSTQRAAWAYVDGAWSWDKRYQFHRCRQRSYSYTTRAINAVENLPLDPLYVAILIALAQRAREVTLPSTLHAHKVSTEVIHGLLSLLIISTAGFSLRPRAPLSHGHN
jgi:hypothetical protein